MKGERSSKEYRLLADALIVIVEGYDEIASRQRWSEHPETAEHRSQETVPWLHFTASLPTLNSVFVRNITTYE